VRQRGQMAAGDHVDAGAEAVFGHPALELRREQPVVAPGEHPRGHFRPSVDGAGLAERDIGLVEGVRRRNTLISPSVPALPGSMTGQVGRDHRRVGWQACSMTLRLIRSDRLYPGVPYAYASIAPRGSLIFTAGACPLDDQGGVVGAGDVRAQASLAMANLGLALAASGATLADVLKTTVFVASADQADLVAAWEVVSAAFGDHDPPSTLLGVAVLGYTGQLVEIEAVAVAAVLLPRGPAGPATNPARRERAELAMIGACSEQWPGCAGIRSSRCWAKTWTPAT
jgi:enamine deaminase RidA (YjgF/YER057c/UK114 family)